MRFSRSLSSPFTPLEIRRAGRAAHRDSAKLQILMEQWASANGVWSQSEFYLQVKQKRKHRSYGSRRWLTRGELLQKYGDSAVVDAIIAAKMADPEASKSQETRQYLVWDKEGEEDTMDDVTTQLFEAADAAEDEEPTKKTKKASGKSGKKQKASHKKKKQAKKGGKKKKAKKSSSSSTQSSSSSSASNDSSDEPDDAKTKKPATKRKGSGTGDENQDRADAGKKLTEEQKRKKAEKEADKKRKEEERKREQEKRKAEKEKEDKLKKEQRSANQVITKLGSNIQRGTSLDDKLSKMSDTIKRAVLAEVQPHLKDLREARKKLEKSIDESKEVESIKIPVVDKKSPRGLRVQSFPILHPHRVLSFLFNDAGIEIDPAKVQEYWHHARSVGDPWSISSPASSSHIPIGLHGDGARLWTVYKVEKHLAISMNLVLFRPRSTRHSRFVLFSIPVDKMYKNRTLNKVWERLTWSLNWAFVGCNPRSGVGGWDLHGADASRAGQPLTRTGLQFAVTEIRGDWEFHRDCWRFSCSWLSSGPMCFRCPAVSRGNTSYLYYNNDAATCAWHSEAFDLQQFIARRLKERQLCPLLKLNGFHPGVIRWCTMHAINLGILFTANAASVILLCEELSFFGPPPFAGQLDSAYKDFLAYCKSHGIRHSQPPFVPKMVLLANRISSVCFECYHDIALLSIKQKRFGLEVWVHHNKLLGAGWCYRWIGCGMRWASTINVGLLGASSNMHDVGPIEHKHINIPASPDIVPRSRRRMARTCSLQKPSMAAAS
ncbi:Uncharacterized protein SCF082_LOCUS53089 [Durusdinium trenchii]|uniref:Uncharacterized protein n=1 Tax=Durusdinium trenchii TaxID=1381693 RepID=A0ABP0SQE2_9DINO